MSFMSLFVCLCCRSCWHAVRRVRVRSRTVLRWCSVSPREPMTPCTSLCLMVGIETHTHTHIHSRLCYLWNSHGFLKVTCITAHWVCSECRMFPMKQLEWNCITHFLFIQHKPLRCESSIAFLHLPPTNIFVHTVHLTPLNCTFLLLPWLLQGLMGTLTHRESWYYRSPSRYGIPRLWSGRVATDTSSSSRCPLFSARKSKTPTGAASICTRASSL